MATKNELERQINELRKRVALLEGKTMTNISDGAAMTIANAYAKDEERLKTYYVEVEEKRYHTYSVAARHADHAIDAVRGEVEGRYSALDNRIVVSLIGDEDPTYEYHV